MTMKMNITINIHTQILSTTCRGKKRPPLWSSGYRFGGPGSIPGTNRKNVLGLERGKLSFVSTTEELRDIKVAAPV
jgi:hypothetical protein